MSGFSLNNQNLLDGVVRSPISYSLNREAGSVTLNFPALTPNLNFQNKNNRSFFRFIAVLGVVSDLQFNSTHAKYYPINPGAHTHCSHLELPWSSALIPSEGVTVELILSGENKPEENDSLILGVGIEFGNPVGNVIEPVKYSGSGKIMMVW
jgi:hypothetical protein